MGQREQSTFVELLRSSKCNADYCTFSRVVPEGRGGRNDFPAFWICLCIAAKRTDILVYLPLSKELCEVL